MNKHCYRIIFNRMRGTLMAVSESALASGRGQSNRAAGQCCRASRSPRRWRMLPLVLGLSTIGVAGYPGAALAQIVAYRQAPGNQQATVLRSDNGVPVVNIQTPSAAGVSRNTYSQFDVDDKGAVLNNSRKGAGSHLAGGVGGNPWLAKGTAKVIVNEVISNDPSQLRGVVEVAGDRAEVVIANPSGVAVDGAGFINASRVVVSTGKVNYQNGAVDNHEIRRGKVVVGERGMDASQADYTAILARAVELNGLVHAKAGKIITGSNRVSADLQQVEQIAGEGPAPAYGLDVSALGGMYAGKITLVGTEHGVGVRNAGRIIATAGEVKISIDGKIDNTGQILGQKDIAVATTKGGTNKGRIYSGGEIKLDMQATLENTGFIGAQGWIFANATGDAGRILSYGEGVLIAGLSFDGEYTPGAQIVLKADVEAKIKSGVQAEEVRISAPEIDVSGGQLLAQRAHLEALLNGRRGRVRRETQDGEAEFDTTGKTLVQGPGINAQGALLSVSEQLGFVTDGPLKTTDAQIFAPQIAVQAISWENWRGVVVQQGDSAMQINLPGTLDNQGGLISAQADIALKAQQVINDSGSLLSSGKLHLNVAGHLRNLQGNIAGEVLTQVNADSAQTTGWISGALETRTWLDNEGRISGDAKAGTLLDNSGQIDGSATAATLYNQGNVLGRATASEELLNRGVIIGSASAGNTLDNSGSIGGSASAGGNLNSSGNIGGSASAGGNLNSAGSIGGSASAGGNLNNSGNIGGSAVAGGDLISLGAIDGNAIASGNLGNTGSIGGSAQAGGSLGNAGTIAGDARAQNDIVGADGSIGGNAISGGRLDNAGKIGGNAISGGESNNQGEITGHLISGARATNAGGVGGSVYAAAEVGNAGHVGGDVSGTIIANSGQIGGSVMGNRIINSGTIASAVSEGTILAKEQLSNTGTIGHAGAQLHVQADQLENAHGKILGGEQMDVVVKTRLDNTEGLIKATGTLRVIDPQTVLDAAQKQLSIVNTGGTLEAGKWLHVDAAELSFDGRVFSGGDFSALLHGDYVNRAGQQFYEASGRVSLGFTGTVTNETAWRHTQDFSLSAGQFINTNGAELRSTGLLSLHSAVNPLVNAGVVHGAGVIISGAGLNNSGGQIGGGPLILDVAQNVNNQQGHIDVNSDSFIRVGGDLLNTGGRIDAGSLDLQVVGSVRSGADGANQRATGIVTHAGDLSFVVGGDFTMQGGDLKSSGQMKGFVRGDIKIDGVSGVSSSTQQQRSWKNIADERSGNAYGNFSGSFGQSLVDQFTYETNASERTTAGVREASAVQAGAGMLLIAGGNASYEGTNLSAGGDLLLGAVRGDLRIAAQDHTESNTTQRNQYGVLGTGVQTSTYTHEYSEQWTGGALNSGGQITLLAGRDLVLEGAQATAAGRIDGLAGRDARASTVSGTQIDIMQQSRLDPRANSEAWAWSSNQTDEQYSSEQKTLLYGGQFNGQGVQFQAGAAETTLFSGLLPQDTLTWLQTGSGGAEAHPRADINADANPTAGHLRLTGLDIDAGSGDTVLLASGGVDIKTAWGDWRHEATQTVAGWLGQTQQQSSAGIGTEQGSLKGANVVIAGGGDVRLTGIRGQAGQLMQLESGGQMQIDSSQLRAEHTIYARADGEIKINGQRLNPQDVPGLTPEAAYALPMSARGVLSAGQQVYLEGAGISLAGSTLRGGDLFLNSSGDVKVEGAVQQRRNGTALTADDALSSNMEGKSLTILGNNISLKHTVIDSEGKALLVAQGNIDVTPGENYYHEYWQKKSSSGSIRKKKTVKTHEREDITAAPSEITAGEIQFIAGGDMTLTAAQLNSAGATTLTAAGDINYLAVQNEHFQQDTKKTSTSFAGIKTGSSSSQVTINERTPLTTVVQSAEDVLSDSGGVTTLQGTKIHSGNGRVQVIGRSGVDAQAVYHSLSTEVESKSSGWGVGLFSPVQTKEVKKGQHFESTPQLVEIGGKSVLISAPQGSVGFAGIAEGKTIQISAQNGLYLLNAEQVSEHNTFESQSKGLDKLGSSKSHLKEQLSATPVVSQLKGSESVTLSGGTGVLDLGAAQITAPSLMLQGSQVESTAAVQLEQLHEVKKKNNLFDPVSSLFVQRDFSGKEKKEVTSETRRAVTTQLESGQLAITAPDGATLVAPTIRADKIILDVGSAAFLGIKEDRAAVD